MLKYSECYLLSLGLNFRSIPRILPIKVLCKRLDQILFGLYVLNIFSMILHVATNVLSHQYRKLHVTCKSEWTPMFPVQSSSP